MKHFVYHNENPSKERINDCVTRAIKLASGLSYPTIRKKLYHTSRLLDCESALCPTCYSFLIQEVLGGVMKDCHGLTVREFAELNPYGTYLIRIEGHLTCLIGGKIYDTWSCLDRMCDIVWKV